VGKGDFEAQARRVFESLAAQLEAAGATFDHVLKMGYFLTNPEDCAKLRKVRAEYLRGDFPASTLLIVKQLFDPDWLIEIEAIAALDWPSVRQHAGEDTLL
jgi:enamine deaminase RidA (YjgF/YER057c/UK114 family)